MAAKKTPPKPKRRALYWRLVVLMPVALREQIEATAKGTLPWDERNFTLLGVESKPWIVQPRGGSAPGRVHGELQVQRLLRRRRFATEEQAARTGTLFLEYVKDQFGVRAPLKGKLSAADEARNLAISAIQAKTIRVVHKPFGQDRHLIGYRMDVVGWDKVRRRVMEVPSGVVPNLWGKVLSPPLGELSEEPLQEGAAANEQAQPQRARGTLFRGARAKENAEKLRTYYLEQGMIEVHLISVFKKGPKPGPVAPEVAAENRAAACGRSKQFQTWKAAFAASANARRRNIFLTPYTCSHCGKFHVGGKRNEVS